MTTLELLESERAKNLKDFPTIPHFINDQYDTLVREVGQAKVEHVALAIKIYDAIENLFENQGVHTVVPSIIKALVGNS